MFIIILFWLGSDKYSRDILFLYQLYFFPHTRLSSYLHCGMTFILQNSLLKLCNSSLPWRDPDGKLTDQSWSCLAVRIFLCSLQCSFLFKTYIDWLIFLFLCLISFVLFPCASVWKNTHTWVPYFPYGIRNGYCFFRWAKLSMHWPKLHLAKTTLS